MPDPNDLDKQADEAEEKGSEKAEALHHAADVQREADTAAEAAESSGDDN